MTLQGLKATYRCSNGYVLEGAALRTCQSDTTWSDDVPSCVLQNETETETMAISPDLGTVVGSVVGVSVVLIIVFNYCSVVLIIVVVILTVIVCCVRRYLKRELEIPTKGPESIEFGKIRR